MLLPIPMFPLLGFLILTSIGRRLGKATSGAIGAGAMLLSLLASGASVWRLLGLAPGSRMIQQDLFTWIASGSFEATVSLRLDPLAALMIGIVSGIGFLIHVYSTGYMHEESDSEFARYFAYLNLFAFFMLVLVLGANFLVMFVGWEGVGLCSYLLIGFWFQKPSAADAGKKAFIVNRIGDFAFILGMLLLFVSFGTLDFQELAAAVAPLPPEATFGVISTAALLLFVGATGKSAQIPLYVWLPDAMEGPTPVSALIHAATMVTAGVYMIGRNAVLFEHAPAVLTIVAVVGTLTALLASTIGLVQTDIKRVLAYSTVSQLGYMFLAMGVGAYAAGIFHLYTHAFFKALLFLGSGAVIHALAGEQDLRRMGGLRRAMPVTYWTFLVGALAISGVPLLSGFFSKDEILYRTFAGGHPWLWLTAAVTSLLTATYMFRLVFLAFHGDPAAPSGETGHHAAAHPHDAPPSMAVPLILLALGSVVAGYAGVPPALGGANRIEHFLESSFTAPDGVGAADQPGAPAVAPPTMAEVAASGSGEAGVELTLMGVSIGAALGGIGLAAFFFLARRAAAEAMAARFAPVHRLLLNKYYVDELYEAALVRPIMAVSRVVLWRGVDVGVIDRSVNGVAAIAGGLGAAIRRVQTGSVRSYAATLLVGAVFLVGYYLW